MSSLVVVAGVLVALLAGGAGAGPRGQRPVARVYVVGPGDTLWRIAESLVDLILSTEPADQAVLMADIIGRFGDLYLEKSGVRESGESASRH